MKKTMSVLFLIFLFIMPKQSLALSCVEPSPPNIAYDEFDAVIIGTVEKIKEKNGEKILTINVQKSYKGVNENNIIVKEDLMWGESQLHSDYLFFLNRDGEEWVNPLCSPTSNNIAMADECFGENEEMPLQNIDHNEKNFKKWSLIAFLVAIFTIVLATFIIRKKKQK